MLQTILRLESKSLHGFRRCMLSTDKSVSVLRLAKFQTHTINANHLYICPKYCHSRYFTTIHKYHFEMMHIRVCNFYWINIMHCLVKNHLRDLVNFSVNVVLNRKNPPTPNNRRRRHHRVKESNRTPIGNRIQADKRNPIELSLNLNPALAAVIRVRMARNRAARIIRNEKNGLHSAWLDQQLLSQPCRIMDTRITKSVGKIWQRKCSICFPLSEMKKNCIQPLNGIVGLYFFLSYI